MTEDKDGDIRLEEKEKKEKQKTQGFYGQFFCYTEVYEFSLNKKQRNYLLTNLEE